MKRACAILFCALGVLMTGTADADNPLLEDWTTPFGVPPFDAIKLEHYEPAFQQAMKRHEQEVRAIYVKRSAPTFDNTIAALDRSGKLLSQVRNVFFPMMSSMTNVRSFISAINPS